MKIFPYVLIALCAVLGSIIAVFLVTLQAEFLETIGISKYGASAIEPVLIVVSLMLGYKISVPHRMLSIVFLIFISIGSLVAVSSIYTKHLFIDLQNSEQKFKQLENYTKSEEVIREALDNLVHRGASSKSTISIIESLKHQQDNIKDASEVTEVKAISNTLSTIFKVNEKDSILMFGFLISFITVFAPSFLFFSLGLIINKLKNSTKNNNISTEDDGLKNADMDIPSDKEERTIEDETVSSTYNPSGSEVTGTDIEDIVQLQFDFTPKPEKNIKEQNLNDTKSDMLKEIKASLIPEVKNIKESLTTYIQAAKEQAKKELTKHHALLAETEDRSQLKMIKSKKHLNIDK